MSTGFVLMSLLNRYIYVYIYIDIFLFGSDPGPRFVKYLFPAGGTLKWVPDTRKQMLEKTHYFFMFSVMVGVARRK